MQSQTRLVRRGSVYYFRARVPADLSAQLGKREILESLRTADKREAERLVRVRSVALDAEFEALRRAASTPTRTTISDEEIAHLVAKAEAVRLGADEESRIHGDAHSDREAELASLEAAGRAAIARGEFTPAMQERAEDWLHGHGYALPRDSGDFRRFAFAFAKAQQRASAKVRQRDSGDPVDTPPMPAGATARGAVTMSDLLSYWKTQKKPRPKTITEAESIVRRFEAKNGRLAPGAVERRHIVAFRDALVAQGREPGTVKKLLGLLSGMFQVAVEDEQLGVKANPARDVRVRGEVGEAKARKAFSVDELNRIFAAPVHAKGERPRGGKGEAAYWLPLLGIFTGARLNEIGQLRLTDVKREDGVDFLHFTNQGEGMQLKKGGRSRKRVPLHAELVRLGFLEYVKRQRAAGAERLFPELRADSSGHLTGNWSKWFNRYLDEVVGIIDHERDFHSFRHTFKQHARASGIAEDQHDSLTGHSNASVSRAYGGAEGYPLKELAKAMRSLRFEGLQIPPKFRG